MEIIRLLSFAATITPADTMCDKVKVQELDQQEQELIKGLNVTPCARFGDTGYTLPILYKTDADNFRNMGVRPDDVWVTSFPRSGTTFTRELVWLLMNDCNFSAAMKTKICERYIFLERTHIRPYVLDQVDETTRGEFYKMYKNYDMIANAPSPRFIYTHLAFSLLPPNLLDTTKVVYMARDPRDVAVSCFHIYRLLRNYQGDFKSFWNLFVNDLVRWSPCLSHVKEAWSLRRHPNMMFIFYENITKDLPSYIKKIADFFGKEVTSKQMVELCEHMDIRNFRKNDSVNLSWRKCVNPDAEGFVRKGGSGGWREYFDEDMAAQAQRWLDENLADTDLRFPQQDAS